MLKRLKRKLNFEKWVRLTLALALALQLLMSGLICFDHTATAAGVDGATQVTICTPYGLKLISLDEDGNPVEDNGQQAPGPSLTCAHCASSCTMNDLVFFSPDKGDVAPHIHDLAAFYIPFSTYENRSTSPPVRGPPLLS